MPVHVPVNLINQLKQILALDGPEFLGQAYLLVLGRPVDPEGFRNYEALLRAGRSKLSILAELRASQEGRAFGVSRTSWCFSRKYPKPSSRPPLRCRIC